MKFLFYFRDFEERYEIIKQGKPFNEKPVISLFEDRHGNGVERLSSLVALIVKEQMRQMAKGKSKADALSDAIGAISGSHKDIFIKPKASGDHNRYGWYICLE